MRFSSVPKAARATWRGIVLAFSLSEVLSRFALLRLRKSSTLTLRDRAEWLHDACTIIVRRLSMDVAVSGLVPKRGLVVSNHLSHLDILLYASVLPCVFVSKSEVLSWPMFGILARCGGTIFVERSRVHGVNHPAHKIAETLRLEIPVILFPEGTSTDGSSVLSFRSALFEPAVVTQSPIRAAAIGYSVRDGIEADLCYYGEITFFPHLLTVLARNGATGNIVFGKELCADDRKSGASTSWNEVVAMRNAMMATHGAQNDGAGLASGSELSSETHRPLSTNCNTLRAEWSDASAARRLRS